MTVDHLHEFVNLWEKLSHVQLIPDMPDSIIWKLTKDGHYSAATAYSAQFLGLVDSDLPQIVWATWAPPKCKFFAWLVINKSIWTADRLQKRRWPNCNMCPLFKRVQESVAHRLFKSLYTVRVWNMIKVWLGLHDIYPQNWAMVDTVKSWWSATASNTTQSRRPLTCLMLLVSWEIWKERNARVFRNVAVPVGVLVARIKDEMTLWCLAGAKHLCNIMPRE